jgi:hypothetical protein
VSAHAGDGAIGNCGSRGHHWLGITLARRKTVWKDLDAL